MMFSTLVEGVAGERAHENVALAAALLLGKRACTCGAKMRDVDAAVINCIRGGQILAREGPA